MGWDGMGWDGMGWDGMGWDNMLNENQVLLFFFGVPTYRGGVPTKNYFIPLDWEG